ncbi:MULTISPECIES: hypothetical protein [Gluconobacter]|uniref:hypothetical protein n=1 Tax=Gluconobacter TaxID=441 RepID=UPI0030A2FB19
MKRDLPCRLVPLGSFVVSVEALLQGQTFTIRAVDQRWRVSFDPPNARLIQPIFVRLHR